MRIADNMAFNQVQSNLAKNRSDLSELQNQASSQKRVTKPSDDALAAARVLGDRVEVQGQEQYLKNINYARTFLDLTDQSLSDVTELLVRAKELALSQANDPSSNERSRRIVATEVQQLFGQAVSVGNRKVGERYLFGGYQTQKTPFDVQGRYLGDDGEIAIQINKDSFIAMSIPGNRVFHGDGVSRDGIVKSNEQPAQTLEAFVEKNKESLLVDESAKNPVPVRGPKGSVLDGEELIKGTRPQGVNLFSLLRGIEANLITNDKGQIQGMLERIDEAVEQVVLARASVGSRIMSLDATRDTLQKSKIDTKEKISSLEDVDVFQVVSDINRSETALKAAMETSGKLIQPSLLDFLR